MIPIYFQLGKPRLWRCSPLPNVAHTLEPQWPSSKAHAVLVLGTSQYIFLGLNFPIGQWEN